MENTANNDTEPGFIALAVLTSNVIRFLELQKEQREESDRETERSDAEKQREEDKRRYIEQRLREAAIWERRISGK